MSFGQRLAAGRNVRVSSALIIALAIAGITGFHPADVAAQGPPANLPGVGPVVLEGELDVLYEDDDERDEARLVHFLLSDNRRIPLRFQDGFAPNLPTGARVRVRGDLADGTITTTSAEVTTLATSASRTLGPQNVLVILFNFSNNQTQPFAASTVAAVNTQVKNFYLENTYGQTVMSFTVGGWYTIAATDAACDYYTWASQAEAAATTAGVNLNAYDRRVFAFPKASSCNWSGMGNLGGPRSWVNGSYSLRPLAHEQGHNFGDHHSKAMRCDSSNCQVSEYGDDRDMMGAVSGHFNAFQKERLGWLNYGSSPLIQTVAASGDYWIDGYETISGSTKALKIWNPSNGKYYYVESRAKIGFDANVAAGVVMHQADSSVVYQVDFDPVTSTFDSTLDIGQVFNDATMGLSIQTLSTSVDGALIRVALNAAPCATKPPTISLAASGSTGYTVTVKNNNGSTCAASVFGLTAAVPTGWSAAFSPASSASLAPGSSASATLTLVAPTGSSGTYTFSATATDASSGQFGSATGSVVIGTVVTSLNVTASASLLGGNGNSRSASIMVSVKAGTQSAAGATVSVVVTTPQGVKSTLNATTGADGVATAKFSLKPKDPSGIYQVQATASGNGATGSAATSFTVP